MIQNLIVGVYLLLSDFLVETLKANKILTHFMNLNSLNFF